MLRRRFGLAMLLLACAAPRVASAAPIGWGTPEKGSDETATTGRAEEAWMMGVRLGYFLPMGSLARGSPDVSDLASGTIPLLFDFGYRFKKHVYVGAYGQYGFVVPANCPSGATCSGSDIRLGAMARLELLPDNKVDPWLALGTGYEWLSITQAQGGNSGSATFRGWEMVNLSAGVSFGSDETRIGPFLGVALAQFDHVRASSVGLASGSGSADIPDTSMHEWLMLGVQGTYDF